MLETDQSFADRYQSQEVKKAQSSSSWQQLVHEPAVGKPLAATLRFGSECASRNAHDEEVGANGYAVGVGGAS